MRTNNMKAELARHSSTAVQEVTDLSESIENVHLRLRLHGRTIPNVPHIDDNAYEMVPLSSNEPSLQLLPVNGEESPGARRPWCFRQGKSVCCLLTFTVRLHALMFICCPCTCMLCWDEIAPATHIGSLPFMADHVTCSAANGLLKAISHG